MSRPCVEADLPEVLGSRVFLLCDALGESSAVADCLRGIGASAIEFCNGEGPAEVLAKIESNEPDCVFLAPRFAGRCGSELLAQMRGRGCETPVVLLLDEGDDELAARARSMGAQEYLYRSELGPRTVLRAVRNARERVDLDRRMGRARGELRESSSGLAHDLRQPLTVIKNNAELLRDFYGAALDAKAIGFLEAQIRMTDRVFRMVAAMLNQARDQVTGSDWRTVDLKACVEETLAGLESAVRATGAEVSVDELPEVRGDRTLLTQVLQNLLGNALKYRSDAAPRIRISARTAGDVVRVTVADNGAGFSTADAERIFEPFVRLCTGRDCEGYGVGLAACRRILTDHGGRIWAEPRSEGGAAFHFELEAAAATMEVAPPAAAGRGRILVLDDESELGDALAEALAKRGYEVRPARSAAEAMEIVKVGCVDLVVSDLLLPGENGVEFVKAVKSGARSLPVIAVSGGAAGVLASTVLAQAGAAGADRVFRKPVEMERLVRAIGALTSVAP